MAKRRNVATRGGRGGGFSIPRGGGQRIAGRKPGPRATGGITPRGLGSGGNVFSRGGASVKIGDRAGTGAPGTGGSSGH